MHDRRKQAPLAKLLGYVLHDPHLRYLAVAVLARGDRAPPDQRGDTPDDQKRSACLLGRLEEKRDHVLRDVVRAERDDGEGPRPEAVGGSALRDVALAVGR